MNGDRVCDPAPDDFTESIIPRATAYSLRSAYGDRVPGGGARWLDQNRPGWRSCTVGGCERPKKARGWCAAHYRRWRLWGDPLGSAPPKVKRQPMSHEEIAAEMDAAYAVLMADVKGKESS